MTDFRLILLDHTTYAIPSIHLPSKTIWPNSNIVKCAIYELISVGPHIDLPLFSYSFKRSNISSHVRERAHAPSGIFC